jgi:GNAT superfamily N-acetyltransferase
MARAWHGLLGRDRHNSVAVARHDRSDGRMEIRDLDVHDDARLREWWEVEQAAHRHDRRQPVLRTLASLTFSARNPSPHYRREPLAALEDGRVVGVADLGYPCGDNEHLADLEICVHPEQRRRGVGRALHTEATRRRRAAGRSSDLGEVHTPVDAPDSPGLAFARALGYADLHREHHLAMALPADPARVAELAASVPADHEVVTWSGRCPDELLDDYVAMRNRMNADAPLGDLDWVPPEVDRERVRLEESRLARTYDSVVAAARRRSDGVMGGYSLTYLGHGMTEAWQDDTLVMPDHRGHGLGLALKLATLALVQRDHPDRTSYHTWTDPENHAMYRTNLRFGYRAIEVMHEMQVRD